MQRTLLILAVLACVIILLLAVKSQRELDAVFADGEIHIVLLEGPDAPRITDETPHVREAWHSVLAELGLPVMDLAAHDLLDLDAAELALTVPAIILPDGRCEKLNRGFVCWLKDYVEAGGTLAVIYDAGVRTAQGNYRRGGALSELTGVQQIAYIEHGADAYTTGHIRFRDHEAAATCRIPPGKLDEGLRLSGYEYGALDYPVVRSRLLADPATVRVLADAVCADLSACPAVVLRELGAGRVCYVNLPLGHLKARADDLPLRSLMEMLLLDEGATPHLMATPRGIGGLVWNWHVDANADWPYLARAIADSVLRESLRCSIHVTAGDGCDEPGDGRGFDACGAGRPHLDALLPYGVIGSHGGMHHNWFAAQFAAGALPEAEVRRLIMDNNSCLASIVDRPIDEYSAPVGYHPQPMMTRILEGLDFVAYYYTGDGGAAPNRAFDDGRMLSRKLISFPVMPLGVWASFEEMDTAGVAPATVAAWLNATSEYCARNRTVRLLYSHPYNIYLNQGGNDYRDVFCAWLDGLEVAQTAGRLQVRPMGEFAGFLLRMLGTDCTFHVVDGRLDVRLVNPLGLQDVTVAVPSDRWRHDVPEGCSTETDRRYHYIVIEGQVNEASFSLDPL